MVSAFRGGRSWEEEKKQKRQLFSAGEKASMALCLAMLIFALQSGDVALCFLIFAFFCYEVQNVMSKIDAKRFKFWISLLWGLCLSTFVGSVFLGFF